MKFCELHKLPIEKLRKIYFYGVGLIPSNFCAECDRKYQEKRRVNARKKPSFKEKSKRELDMEKRIANFVKLKNANH